MTKILIVDDDPGVRQALRELCQAEGLVCAESPDGADALEMVHTWSPDLILLDLCMPVVSGETVAEILRSSNVRHGWLGIN